MDGLTTGRIVPDSSRHRVVFGLGGAWGFAPGDLTSPARAARAGAFTDNGLPVYEPDFTELRVHGVSGSSGPVMLEHQAALQVAGDGTAMFYLHMSMRDWRDYAVAIPREGPFLRAVTGRNCPGGPRCSAALRFDFDA
jgi:hypothetical protein